VFQHLKTDAADASTHDAAVGITIEMLLADIAMTAVGWRPPLVAPLRPSRR